MITPQDIRNILYNDCHAFGIDEVYVVFEGDEGNSDEIPTVKSKYGLQKERVVVYVKGQQPGTYWKKNFNEVNIQVPRINNRANTIRLNELEHKALEVLDDVVGEYGGCSYYYKIDSIGTEADTALKCHYVNVRILFQVLNVD